MVDTIGESFGIDSKESAVPHTGSQTLHCQLLRPSKLPLHMFISRQICFVALGHFSMDIHRLISVVLMSYLFKIQAPLSSLTGEFGA